MHVSLTVVNHLIRSILQVTDNPASLGFAMSFTLHGMRAWDICLACHATAITFHVIDVMVRMSCTAYPDT